MWCRGCGAILSPGRGCDRCALPPSRGCAVCGVALPIGARFCSQCGARLASPDGLDRRAPDLDAAPVIRKPFSAERREITVLFCDIVDSTALSTQLDPEDLCDLMRSYHDRVAEIVNRRGGYVANYMGDGVLAYFGYPRAHENDAERAVQAGLALVDGARDLNSGRPLALRVGIASGPVVIGDDLKAGYLHEKGVVGEAPNLASRLQALAAPDTVIIDDPTRRLTGGLFDYVDLGPLKVKGFAAAVRGWRVQGANATENRFEALRSAKLPLVGREQELLVFNQLWNQARSGPGQIILLSGEAGIGKSRLISAFEDTLPTGSCLTLRYYCSEQHTDSPLYPLRRQLERAARFEREDGAERKFEKLERCLADAETPRDDVRLLAEFLSAPVPLSYPDLGHTPQRRRQKTFEALLRLFEGLASRPALVRAGGPDRRQGRRHPVLHRGTGEGVSRSGPGQSAGRNIRPGSLAWADRRSSSLAGLDHGAPRSAWPKSEAGRPTRGGDRP